MKHNLSLLVGAALLGLASGAVAATAVTDPVGYITIDVAAKPAGATITPIAPTLVNKVDFAGAVTAINPTTISFAAGSLTAGAFNAVAGVNKYYVEITSGPGEGAWTNITANTADGITVADDMAPFAAAGATVKIRAHVTVDQFLGASNTAGLVGGGDSGLADEVFFVDASAGTTTSIFFDPSAPGWFDADFNAAGGLPIEPQQGLLVKHKNATPVKFTAVGHVKTGKTLLGVYSGLNVVSVPRATGVTFADSGLFSGSNATGVNPGDDGGVADEVFVYNNGTPISYFNDGTGWVDADFAPAGTVNLKEGSAVVIKRKIATAFNWAVPKVTISETP